MIMSFPVHGQSFFHRQNYVKDGDRDDGKRKISGDFLFLARFSFFIPADMFYNKKSLHLITA